MGPMVQYVTIAEGSRREYSVVIRADANFVVKPVPVHSGIGKQVVI